MPAKDGDKQGKPKVNTDPSEEIKRQTIFGTGYGKPPKDKQFKKGQPGNPYGRPRKAPVEVNLSDQPMLSAVLKSAGKTVRMREGDKTTEVPGVKCKCPERKCPLTRLSDRPEPDRRHRESARDQAE